MLKKTQVRNPILTRILRLIDIGNLGNLRTFLEKNKDDSNFEELLNSSSPLTGRNNAKSATPLTYCFQNINSAQFNPQLVLKQGLIANMLIEFGADPERGDFLKIKKTKHDDLLRKNLVNFIKDGDLEIISANIGNIYKTNPQFCKEMLSSDIQVQNRRNNVLSYPPLHYCVSLARDRSDLENRKEITNKLIEFGADPEQKDYAGRNFEEYCQKLSERIPPRPMQVENEDFGDKDLDDKDFDDDFDDRDGAQSRMPPEMTDEELEETLSTASDFKIDSQQRASHQPTRPISDPMKVPDPQPTAVLRRRFSSHEKSLPSGPDVDQRATEKPITPKLKRKSSLRNSFSASDSDKSENSTPTSSPMAPRSSGAKSKETSQKR